MSDEEQSGRSASGSQYAPTSSEQQSDESISASEAKELILNEVQGRGLGSRKKTPIALLEKLKIDDAKASSQIFGSENKKASNPEKKEIAEGKTKKKLDEPRQGSADTEEKNKKPKAKAAKKKRNKRNKNTFRSKKIVDIVVATPSGLPNNTNIVTADDDQAEPISGHVADTLDRFPEALKKEEGMTTLFKKGLSVQENGNPMAILVDRTLLRKYQMAKLNTIYNVPNVVVPLRIFHIPDKYNNWDYLVFDYVKQCTLDEVYQQDNPRTVFGRPLTETILLVALKNYFEFVSAVTPLVDLSEDHPVHLWHKDFHPKQLLFVEHSDLQVTLEVCDFGSAEIKTHKGEHKKCIKKNYGVDDFKAILKKLKSCKSKLS